MRAGINSSDVVSVYCSLIRTILEYASPVWHAGLTKTQSDRIEGVQKRCLQLFSLTFHMKRLFKICVWH